MVVWVRRAQGGRPVHCLPTSTPPARCVVAGATNCLVDVTSVSQGCRARAAAVYENHPSGFATLDDTVGLLPVLYSGMQSPA